MSTEEISIFFINNGLKINAYLCKYYEYILKLVNKNFNPLKHVLNFSLVFEQWIL